jgi:hypothetical protein
VIRARCSSSALSAARAAPKAAVEGRLPRGFGLKRLVDLPMAWPDQWRGRELQTPRTGVGNGPRLLVCLPARGDPSIPTGSSVEVRIAKGRSKSGAVDMWQTATLETEIGPVAIFVGIDWRVFGRHEAIRSCGEVNDLIVWFLGEGLPSVDLAHGDLS